MKSPLAAPARILFCTHDIELGGSPRSMGILVEELAKRNEIAIVTMREPHPENPAFLKYRRMGIPVYYFPWGWLPVSYVNCPVNIPAQKARNEQMEPFCGELRTLAKNYDLACINGYPASSLAALLPPAMPRVLLAREILLEDDACFPEAWRLLRANISAAVAIGPLEAAQLQKLGIPHITVFNSSENLPVFRPMPPLPVKFGAFSRFGPGKGLDTLARAVANAAVELRKSSATVHIFGANSAKPNGLELQIRHFAQKSGISELLKIEDYTTSPEEQMKAVHCIIRPDDSGSPWGRDVIEALSMGRPVLATGKLDVFVKSERTGWLVPPGDSEAMSAALKRLAENPELLAEAGRNAAMFAKERFNRALNSSRIEEYLMRQIAGARN